MTNLELINVKISELKPYENNPRINSGAVDKVQASIAQFGFKVPLVIDADNVIVCGHTRYLAAQKLGLDEVPCVVASDLSEDQIKAFRLADNKVSEFSRWDWDKLQSELDSVDMSMFDFGFDSVQPDDFPEPDEEPEDDGDEPQPDSSATADHAGVRVGEYNFMLTSSEYLALIETVKLESGFTKDEVIAGLKKRLLGEVACN